MLIATVEALRARVNYQRREHVTAEDIFHAAVHVAYVQMGLLYVPAVIYRRNSLSLETWDRWPIPAHLLGGGEPRLALPR